MNYDLALFDLKMFLSANKSEWWRNYYIEMATVLSNFLLENELLINISPFNDNGLVDENLVIKKSNLTSEGFELFKKAIPNWYKAHERGTPVEKTTI